MDNNNDKLHGTNQQDLAVELPSFPLPSFLPEHLNILRPQNRCDDFGRSCLNFQQKLAKFITTV